MRELSIASEPSKFPECKQMINEAWVVSNHLFIFHWGHEWVSDESTRYFCVMLLYYVNKVSVNSQKEVQKY